MSLTLAQYRSRTRRLLQNPPSPTSLYSDDDVDAWINQARVQVAGESNAIRYLATIDTVIDQRNYNFSGLNTGVVNTTGISGIFHIRSIMFAVGSGYKWVSPRSWEWMQTFQIATPVPSSGEPVDWAQFAQGSSGSFYLDPIPDAVYSLTCDCVCKPADLTETVNQPPDAIPDLWSDAVAYFAAFLALLSAQTGQREAQADRMFQRYEEFVKRARQFANPDVNNSLYAQAQDPTLRSKLGAAGPM